MSALGWGRGDRRRHRFSALMLALALLVPGQGDAASRSQPGRSGTAAAARG